MANKRSSLRRTWRPSREDWKFASMEEIQEWTQQGFKEASAKPRRKGSHGMD